MKDDTETFTAKIDAYLRQEERAKERETKSTLRKVGTVIGTVFGGIFTGAVVVMAAPVAASALVVAAAAGSAGALGAGGFGVVGYKVADSIESDVWKDRTETLRYKAPSGHVVTKDPAWESSGQGRVRMLKRDEHGFDYEITAFQGEFSAIFTSYERWMHRAGKGEFDYRQSVSEYMADLRKAIEIALENDRTGAFDVIQFLKDARGDKPTANRCA